MIAKMPSWSLQESFQIRFIEKARREDGKCSSIAMLECHARHLLSLRTEDAFWKDDIDPGDKASEKAKNDDIPNPAFMALL